MKTIKTYYCAVGNEEYPDMWYDTVEEFRYNNTFDPFDLDYVIIKAELSFVTMRDEGRND